MHDPILIWGGLVGVVVAIANALVRTFRWNQPPQLAAFIDILLSFLGITIAIKVAIVALALPSNEVGDVDKFYFCLGSLAIFWVSLESIIRRFKS
jgi:hypothetical protein